MGTLPSVNMFPGFTALSVVSPQIAELVVTFNAEGVESLQAIPAEAVAWADIGTRVTAAPFEAKIPLRLTSLLGFEPFKGERSYHPLTVAAVTVKVSPYHLDLEWPIQFTSSGIAQLPEMYGISGVAQDVVMNARAHKADMVASIIAAGFTNSVLGLTAKATTLPQPGYVSGLPLFSDGSETPKHFANPLDPNSARFANLFYAAGKLDEGDTMGDVITNMMKVPHPSKANMTMMLGVTDLIGPTSMLRPFMALAQRNLSLQIATGGASAAATTNIYKPETLAQVNAAGLTPWRFHIAPQLDSHPYVVANSGKQMWIAVSRSRPGASWCELAAPTKEFTPQITLFGDGTPDARKYRKIQLISDLDAGGAAGLPHFAQMYFETLPT